MYIHTYICIDFLTTIYIVFSSATVGLTDKCDLNSNWRTPGCKVVVKGILFLLITCELASSSSRSCLVWRPWQAVLAFQFLPVALQVTRREIITRCFRKRLLLSQTYSATFSLLLQEKEKIPLCVRFVMKTGDTKSLNIHHRAWILFLLLVSCTTSVFSSISLFSAAFAVERKQFGIYPSIVIVNSGLFFLGRCRCAIGDKTAAQLGAPLLMRSPACIYSGARELPKYPGWGCVTCAGKALMLLVFKLTMSVPAWLCVWVMCSSSVLRC